MRQGNKKHNSKDCLQSGKVCLQIYSFLKRKPFQEDTKAQNAEQKKRSQNIQSEIGFSLLSQNDSSILEDDLNKYKFSLEK